MVKDFQRSSEIVPANLDATKWSELQPLYQELIDRDLHCKNCLHRLIMDRSELDAAVSEAFSTLYIRMTCHTDDQAVSKAFSDFVENVEPKLKDVGFQLNRKIVESPVSRDLDPARYGVMLRDLRAEVEIFRAENIPLFTQLSKLEQKYAQICGGMMVQFQGSERTLPQMGAFGEESDRSVREAAWRAVAGRRAADAETLDGLFDELVQIRNQVAINAGFANFRDYAFKMKRRFDYTPTTCNEFAAGVEAHVTPMARKATLNRARLLGVPTVRPWDTTADVDRCEPLRPFVDAAELVDKTSKVFARMDPELAAMFRFLCDTPHGSVENDGGLHHSLDLDSRKGKAPGGYQSNRDRIRKPFIFMNAAGLQRDVETLLHEAGHAFHALLTRQEPLLHYRAEIPLEFAEVASMSMELLTYPYLDEFYTPDEVRRAKRTHLEQMLKLLTSIAIGDQFQHWVYLNPKHTRQERHAKWRELTMRYGAGVDWSGLDQELGVADWQRILHLFQTPFYYIEYAIAQLGALQIWMNSTAEISKLRERGERQTVGPETLGAYKRALSLGGSRTLPELFQAAGATFDFGPKTIGRLAHLVEAELASVSL